MAYILFILIIAFAGVWALPQNNPNNMQPLGIAPPVGPYQQVLNPYLTKLPDNAQPLYGPPKYPMPTVNQTNLDPYSFTSPDPECENVTMRECIMRQRKCWPTSLLISGPRGSKRDIFLCTRALAIPKASFVGFIGDAVRSGHPETIVDKITEDPALSYHLRRCILIQNGMLGPDDTINRVALNSNIQAAFGWNAPLVKVVLDAAESCPDHEDLKYVQLLSCIRQQCVQKFPITSLTYQHQQMRRRHYY